MLNNLTVNKILWFIIASISLIVACIGVFNQTVYSHVLNRDLLPGTVAQDMITILSGVVLVVLSVTTKEADVKKPIVALSLLAYVWYGYGIYVIERLYNPLYLLYMAIIALAFWAIVYGLVTIKSEVIQRAEAPTWVRNLSAGCLLVTAALFYVLWTGQLVPLMRTGERVEFLYAIFILDMAFVLPALVISGVLLIKNKAWGVILAPILFFKAFTLLFSVGLGGLLKPFYGQTTDQGEMAFYFILSLLYLVFAVVNFWTISVRKPGHV